MKRLFTVFSLIFAGLVGFSSFGQARQNTQPAMYVVMFRADWCGACKIVEPNLSRAMAALNDPSLQVLVIDITDGPRTERSANLAFDAGIVPQYNNWYGVTGFAAMIDADTKRTLGCVNMVYNAQAMAQHIAALKTYALSNQPSPDTTCPAPNRL